MVGCAWPLRSGAADGWLLEITIDIPGGIDRAAAFGPAERSLKALREALGVSLSARGNSVRILGERDRVEAAGGVVRAMVAAAERGRPMGRRQVLDAIADGAFAAHVAVVEGDVPHDAPFEGRLNVTVAGRAVGARSANQQKYLDMLFTKDLVFGIGPAGTGKTFLAVAAAVHMLKAGRIKRAILARPAVEAGERLGFLPGDEMAKVSPYLRPLMDALGDMLDYQTIKRFIASDVIEVIPLAFMRGRTFNDAVVILDEAQNATRTQMQMVLTRLGQRSKMIINGDVTQTDLPRVGDSGLLDAVQRLSGIAEVGVCALEKTDVVRHDLVQRVIDAYAPKGEGGSEPMTSEVLGLEGGRGDG